MKKTTNVQPPKGEKLVQPPKEEETKQSENVEQPKRVEVANDKLTENSISTEAIDFEDSAFLEKNKHAGKPKEKKETKTEEDSAEAYEQSFIDKELQKTEEEENLTEEEAMDKVIREIAEQPFEVAMNNLEVSKESIIRAAAGVFSNKGYFEQEFKLPFNGSVTLRSKTVNDYIDYTEYVRRLLIEPISQKEFDTFTQLRNLAYAIVELDGDDWSAMSIDDRFNKLRGTSEVKITAIINTTKEFWRICHLLLHPGLVDFLASTPEE